MERSTHRQGQSRGQSARQRDPSRLTVPTVKVSTYIFTDYLSKVSPGWQSGPVYIYIYIYTPPPPPPPPPPHIHTQAHTWHIKWPVGIGQKGSEGVSGMVRQSPNSIGCVELIYASENKIPYGQVKNAAGKFLKATTDGVTAAAAADAKAMPADYRVSITNASGSNSYPISSFTWLLIPTHFNDAAKGKAIADFPGLDAGSSVVKPEAGGMSWRARPPKPVPGHGLASQSVKSSHSSGSRTAPTMTRQSAAASVFAVH